MSVRTLRELDEVDEEEDLLVLLLGISRKLLAHRDAPYPPR
jgi:hypothetical protein